MKVKKYHTLSKGDDIGYISVDGILELRNKRVFLPIGKKNSQTFPNAIPQSFIYDDFGFRTIANIRDSSGNIIDVRKKIWIKEVEIKDGNASSLNWHEEYLIEKNWWNEQQLKFMFGTHWIQSDFRFWIPVLISSVTLLITGVNTFNSSKKIDKIEEWKDSLSTQIKVNENTIITSPQRLDTLKTECLQQQSEHNKEMQ
jgi:hypothetical protein